MINKNIQYDKHFSQQSVFLLLFLNNQSIRCGRGRETDGLMSDIDSGYQ